MAYEMLIGLDVSDQESYARYRAGMTPILERFGGGFGYDLEVAKVLKSPRDAGINRVFTIHFPSQSIANAFFQDESYREVRAAHFEPAVQATTIMAAYERSD